MKIRFQILVFILFLGLAGQTVHSWLSYSKFQVVLVEEESKKNEKVKDQEKDKFFEYSFIQPGLINSSSFFILLKENFQNTLFHSLPERPPTPA